MSSQFCTLFDAAYLSRGLALYHSLNKHCPAFHLYVLAMDDLCATLLNTMALPDLTVITLADFETDELLAIKPSRTRGEYCWTCTPFILRHCLERYQLNACTYLDADICFFANPDLLLQEIPAVKSVLITEHHYTPEYDQTATSGRFCVQFVTFKNTEAGHNILNTWANQCHEWCFSYCEPGRFGDQKYQDVWPDQWPKDVHILQHLGGGVAPWNIQQYSLMEQAGKLYLSKGHNAPVRVIFYHFHSLLFCNDHSYWLGSYQIEKNVIDLLYVFYTQELQRIGNTLAVPLPFGPYQQAPSLLRRIKPLLLGNRFIPRNVITVK